MEKEEELKNTELNQMDEMEGEAYDDEEFEDQEEMQHDMEGESNGYDQEAMNQMQNPYNPNDAIRNTFYPSQNPMMGPGFGGALRPVSANVMKGGGRRGPIKGKNK
jgi:hypothetical protein